MHGSNLGFAVLWTLPPPSFRTTHSEPTDSPDTFSPSPPSHHVYVSTCAPISLRWHQYKSHHALLRSWCTYKASLSSSFSDLCFYLCQQRHPNEFQRSDFQRTSRLFQYHTNLIPWPYNSCVFSLFCFSRILKQTVKLKIAHELIFSNLVRRRQT